MNEDDIKSYIKQFSVDRETAIKEINEALEEHHQKQDNEMQKVYEDIIKSSH